MGLFTHLEEPVPERHDSLRDRSGNKGTGRHQFPPPPLSTSTGLPVGTSEVLTLATYLVSTKFCPPPSSLVEYTFPTILASVTVQYAPAPTKPTQTPEYTTYLNPRVFQCISFSSSGDRYQFINRPKLTYLKLITFKPREKKKKTLLTTGKGRL